MAEQRKANGGGIIALLAKNKVVFGSDVYAAYSFEYVWGANQFGHVLIGLFPGLLFVWLTGNSPWGALIVIGVYALKETVDYLIAVRLVENVFKPNIREALLDGIVDWCFVAWGAFIAASVLGGMGLWWKIGAFAGTFLFFLLMRLFYLPGKISFDRSGLPKFVRLPTFPEGFVFGVPKTDPAYETEKRKFAERILQFAQDDAACTVRHLVIAGPRSSGRSTFAMAVGGDAASGPKRRKDFRVRYVTGAQLREIANDRMEVASKERPWCVAEANLIVVDELDPVLLPLSSEAAAEDALNRLVDVAEKPCVGEAVFLRGLGTINPNAPPKWIPGPARPREKFPRTIWVACHHSMSASEAHREGEVLQAVLAKKFGVARECVELVKLEGHVFERRTRTKVRAEGQEA